MSPFYFILLLLPLCFCEAPGFASSVTGGSKGPTVWPTTIKELENYLTSSSPYQIIIDGEYNFLHSMGERTETGCRPYKCDDVTKEQEAINPPFNWCGNNPKVSVTYDVAATQFIDVKSDKTLIGKPNTVITGKGLRLVGDNIIIKNIHFTKLNPKYVWGGDAIYITGSDLVWIDHCTFSRVGRQFLVIADKARGHGRISITNNDFDGYTPFSSRCDNHHYWVMYLTGENFKVSLYANYIRTTSGRGPKIGEDGVPNNLIVQVVNNYWSDVSWHAFDTNKNDGFTLIEGNIFENVSVPRLNDGNQEAFFVGSSPSNICKSFIGRACEANHLIGSGSTKTDTYGRINQMENLNLIKPMAVNLVKSSVMSGAGVNK